MAKLSAEPIQRGSERTEFKVCGRVVGTATGWDAIDDAVIVLYNLIPVPELEIPAAAADTAFELERGVIEQYDEDGEVVFTADLIDSLVKVRKA